MGPSQKVREGQEGERAQTSAPTVCMCGGGGEMGPSSFPPNCKIQCAIHGASQLQLVSTLFYSFTFSSIPVGF